MFAATMARSMTSISPSRLRSARGFTPVVTRFPKLPAIIAHVEDVCDAITVNITALLQRLKHIEGEAS